MDIQFWILIGQATVYIVNSILNVFLIIKYNRNVLGQIEILRRQTEPIQTPPVPVPAIEQQPDTATVNRDTAVRMNAYYDPQRNAYELSPSN